jgi:hypothetical protein
MVNREVITRSQTVRYCRAAKVEKTAIVVSVCQMGGGNRDAATAGMARGWCCAACSPRGWLWLCPGRRVNPCKARELLAHWGTVGSPGLGREDGGRCHYGFVFDRCLPRARWRRRWWWVRSIQLTIAMRSCSRMFQRRVSRTLRCSRQQKSASMAAISPQAPTRPIVPTRPLAASVLTYFLDRN